MPSWPSNETNYKINDLQIIRIPGKLSNQYSNKLITKLHSHLDFLDHTRVYLDYVNKIEILDKYYDIILSFSDPKASHVFAYKLIQTKKFQYGRWIQHWGDPITGDFTRNYWWPDWFVKLYERSFIRKADKAVYVTPFTYDLLVSEHPSLIKKLAFTPLPADMLPSVNKIESKVLHVSYLGDYNPKIRNLRPLYEACANKKDIRLTIAGYGPKYADCDNVKVLSRIPHGQVRVIENESDVLACICNLTGCMIPGKITYKSSTNKHILVALEDDNYEAMKAYFESYERYIICRNTVDSISEALNSLRGKEANYTTPYQLLPTTVAQKIIE